MDKTGLIKMGAMGDKTPLTINWKFSNGQVINTKNVTAGDILEVEKKLKALGHDVLFQFTKTH